MVFGFQKLDLEILFNNYWEEMDGIWISNQSVGIQLIDFGGFLAMGIWISLLLVTE